LQGAPHPGGEQAITLSNIDQVKALSRWGMGIPQAVYFAPTTGWLGVVTALGDYAFQPPDFTPFQPPAAEWALVKASGGPQYTLDYSRCARTPCPDADLLRDGEVILTLQATGNFAVSPNGFYAAAELLSGGVQQLWLHDLYSGQPPRQLDTQADGAAGLPIPCFHEITGLQFSPEADLLAAACQGGGIYLFQTADGALLSSLGPAPEAQAIPPSWLWFSPDNQRLLSYQAGLLLAWNIAPGQQQTPAYAIAVNGAVDALKAISRDGRWLAVGQIYGEVLVYDLENGSLSQTLLAPAPGEDLLAISPDGNLAATSSSTFTGEKAIQLRRLSDGAPLKTLLLPSSQALYLYQAAFTPQGDLLLVSTSNGVYAWSLPGGQADAAASAGRISQRCFQIAVHPTGQALVTLQENGVSAYTLPELKGSGAQRGPANPLAFALSPSGEQIVIGAEGVLQVRSYPESRRVLDFDLPGYQVEGLRFTADGSRLLVTLYSPGQDTRDYQLYDAGNWKLLLQAPPTIELGVVQAFSPDGLILATRNDFEIVLRRTADLRGVVSLPGHGDFVYNLAFSPDGALLLSTSFDGSIRVWGIP
jgi:WD40 repeat protein